MMGEMTLRQTAAQTAKEFCPQDVTILALMIGISKNCGGKPTTEPVQLLNLYYEQGRLDGTIERLQPFFHRFHRVDGPTGTSAQLQNSPFYSKCCPDGFAKGYIGEYCCNSKLRPLCQEIVALCVANGWNI